MVFQPLDHISVVIEEIKVSKNRGNRRKPKTLLVSTISMGKVTLVLDLSSSKREQNFRTDFPIIGQFTDKEEMNKFLDKFAKNRGYTEVDIKETRLH